MREACYQCHSQMIRTLRFEVERYGPYTVADSVYDRPFQWGSKRTGPDLARIGGKYSDEWHRLHLLQRPRDLVPESNMPNYPWLGERELDGRDIQARMRVLRQLGDPYTDGEIEDAPDAVKGRSSSTPSSLICRAWARLRQSRVRRTGDELSVGTDRRCGRSS